jgi:hypothetical protein
MMKRHADDGMQRVMNALRYSLARYLRFAQPRVEASTQPIADAVGHVANAHGKHVKQIGEFLLERHGHVESQTYPLAFTRLNNLSIRYLLPLVVDDERQIIRLVDAAANEFERDAAANELLAEVGASGKRHLQMLREVPEHHEMMPSDMPVAARRRTPVRSTRGEDRHVRRQAVRAAPKHPQRMPI